MMALGVKSSLYIYKTGINTLGSVVGSSLAEGSSFF